MEWIANNWFFLLIVAVFAGMHFFGFGCCGHRKHGNHSQEECDEHKKHAGDETDGEEPKKAGHGCCG